MAGTRGVQASGRAFAVTMATAAALIGLVVAAHAQGMPLSKLVREVKVALQKVERSAAADNLPALETATLEINSILTVGADGKISFWVVEFGADVSATNTSIVKLTLKPPPPDAPTDVAPARLADALAKAIIAGAKAIDEAGRGNPPLDPVSLEATVKFALQVEGSGEIKLVFPPVQGSAGASLSSGVIQSITVRYKY